MGALTQRVLSQCSHNDFFSASAALASERTALGRRSMVGVGDMPIFWQSESGGSAAGEPSTGG